MTPQRYARQISARALRFRIWQRATQVHALQCTQRQLADELDVHQTTISLHLSALGITLQGKDHYADPIQPVDHFMEARNG
jgi:hypothetical protein